MPEKFLFVLIVAFFGDYIGLFRPRPARYRAYCSTLCSISR